MGTKTVSEAFCLIQETREKAFKDDPSLDYLETLQREVRLFMEETNRHYRRKIRETQKNNQQNTFR